jgi:hypothetical protein
MTAEPARAIAELYAVDLRGRELRHCGGYCRERLRDGLDLLHRFSHGQRPTGDVRRDIRRLCGEAQSGGSALLYSTYLDGSDSDQGDGISVDAAGNAYVTGFTNSSNFPTASPLQVTNAGGDAFVAKLNAAGNTLLYSTYLGGSGGDEGLGIAVDDAGGAYMTGHTSSSNFPMANPLQSTFAGGDKDAFVAKLSDVVAPTPATLILAPNSATNPVNTQHCVMATVKDAVGNPLPGITVRFRVTGSSTTSGSMVTNAAGQANFCYAGPPSAGSDTIAAYADTDNDSTQGVGEPSNTATKTWTAAQVGPPTSSKSCQKGGWKTFNTPRTFKNEGECIKYFNAGK